MNSIFVYQNPGSGMPAESEGGLQAVRIALQPNFAVAGWPADAGSNALCNYKAPEDATAVQRLRQAGAELCGFTRMSEFGLGLEGSSAGTALAARKADAELMLDLLGESRLMAARRGTYGFKPSCGIVSRLGLTGLSPSMESCGILADNIDQIHDILKTVAGPDALDFSMPADVPTDFSLPEMEPRQVTIGVVEEAEAFLAPAPKKAFSKSVARLAEAGCTLLRVSIPEFPLFALVHRIVGSVEASSSAGRYDSVRYGQRPAGVKNWNEMYLQARGAAFGQLLKEYLFQGAYFQFEDYKAYENACRIRARLLKDMQRLMTQIDFLALPTEVQSETAGTDLKQVYALAAATVFANVTGAPALHLPGAADNGLAGIQLSGARLSDCRLLALAKQL